MVEKKNQKKKKRITPNTCKLQAIHSSMSINKVLLEHSGTHLFTLPLAAFVQKGQAESLRPTAWLVRPKIGTIWPFTGKVC